MKVLQEFMAPSWSARRLGAVRMGLCAVLALRLASSPYLALAEQPRALFRPISFMTLFERMPSPAVTRVVLIAGVALALLAAAGVYARVTLPGAWFCGVFLGGMATSIGKVVHNDVLLILAMVPLLPARTSDAWSVDSWRKRRPVPDSSPQYGWPVRGTQIVVAVAYLLTGLAKLINSGAGWFMSDNLRWVLLASSDGQAQPNQVALFVAGIPLLARAFALATLVVEVGFVLVLFFPRLSWWFVLGAVGLHLGIYLSMELDYSAWIAAVIIVFADWPGLKDRFASSRQRSAPRPA